MGSAALTCPVRLDGRSASAPPGTRLFDLAGEIGITMPSSCGGKGKCRECLLEIVAGEATLSSREAEEEHLPTGFRLACRARVASSEGELLCHTMRRGALRIVDSAERLDTADAAPDEPLFERHGVDLRRGDKVLAQLPSFSAPVLGLAVDLGTTAVVLSLHELDSGRLLATHAFENPQRFGGSDVMSRIRYDTDHPGRLLQRVLLGYLGRAIEALPADPTTIFEIVVVGNTTMRDIFFGLDVASIGQMPYRSISEWETRNGSRKTTSLEIPARRLGLPLNRAATAYGPPLIASHLGSDAAACLLAAGLAEQETVSACMDIGTNTELIVGNRHRLLAASCPAGPAFEGGAISCGMPGLEGAIEAIRIEGDNRVTVRVIGETEPIGICGSGLVDLLGELLRTGRMSSRGRYTPGADLFMVDESRGIAFRESDISELAQAKGANAAGLRVLLDRYGIEMGDIDRLYLAGGFGRHLDIDAARRIGLVPDLPNERIVQVGNAALAGARRLLGCAAARRRLERLVRTVEHVQLETYETFFDYFVEGCQFVPIGSDT